MELFKLKTKLPGDSIRIVRREDGNKSTLIIGLTARPFKGINHVADRFSDGRSERRDGFENVFIHDAKLKPTECGGPIFDTKGQFVGLNMARYSRTSSLGMTASEVLDFIKIVSQ